MDTGSVECCINNIMQSERFIMVPSAAEVNKGLSHYLRIYGNVKSSVSLIICYDHKGAIKVNVKYGGKDFKLIKTFILLPLHVALLFASQSQ